MILWLAWHGQRILRAVAFGLTLKASEAEKFKTVETVLTGAEEEILRFQDDAISGLKDLDARLSALEDRADSRST